MEKAKRQLNVRIGEEFFNALQVYSSYSSSGEGTQSAVVENALKSFFLAQAKNCEESTEVLLMVGPAVVAALSALYSGRRQEWVASDFPRLFEEFGGYYRRQEHGSTEI